jgi:hypothetical protein
MDARYQGWQKDFQDQERLRRDDKYRAPPPQHIRSVWQAGQGSLIQSTAPADSTNLGKLPIDVRITEQPLAHRALTEPVQLPAAMGIGGPRKQAAAINQGLLCTSQMDLADETPLLRVHWQILHIVRQWRLPLLTEQLQC